MDFLLQVPVQKTTETSVTKSFKPPPLDGSLTTPQLYDWHYEHNPTHPVFVFSNAHGPSHYHTYSDVVPAIHRAGRYVAHAVNIDLKADPSTFPVVGIIATSGGALQVGIGMLRANIPIFTISPRYSPNVVAHLLAKTRTTHVLISVEESIRILVHKAIEVFAENHPDEPCPSTSYMPSYDTLYIDDVFERLPSRPTDYSATTIIVHSSGSTSLPKPIRWNARRDLQTVVCPLFGSQDFCGQVFGCYSIELFHGLGLSFIFWPVSTGLIMATFPPSSPATIPTPSSVFQGLCDLDPSYVLVSPGFIQEWGLDLAKVRRLSRLKGLVYAGSHLNRAIGNHLTKHGVEIYTIYGSSEVGYVSTVFPERLGYNWEYIEINPHCSAEFVARGDNTYELFVLGKPTQELAIKNAELLGLGAYDTRDIFVRHPQKPNLYRILGRQDDEITLSNGETTNPGPLEDILCQHPQVAAAVMFGRNRARIGVIVELKDEYAFNPENSVRLTEFRENIWPKVQEMNAYAKEDFRLAKEMITVAKPSKPFSYTIKHVPNRPTILGDYLEEITAFYKDDGGSKGN